MPETLSFKNETERIEHEARLGYGEKHMPKVEKAKETEVQVESKPALTAEKALKSVAEASQETDTQKVLDKLEEAQNEPQTMSRSDISRAQRLIAKQRGLKQVREQESFPEKTLSKVIHQPVIRAISEGAGKTVSRPSGLLGGGLAAFIGSGSYLVLAKSLHFTYNYSVSLALFVGGFCFGLILELLVHYMTASHRQVD